MSTQLSPKAGWFHRAISKHCTFEAMARDASASSTTPPIAGCGDAGWKKPTLELKLFLSGQSGAPSLRYVRLGHLPLSPPKVGGLVADGSKASAFESAGHIGGKYGLPLSDAADSSEVSVSGTALIRKVKAALKLQSYQAVLRFPLRLAHFFRFQPSLVYVIWLQFSPARCSPSPRGLCPPLQLASTYILGKVNT